MKRFAFTLAEMMVVLLVLSIAIAAFAPMMTQRSRQSGGGGDLWQKTTGGIYYNLGNAESVIIGDNVTDSASLVIKNLNNTANNHIIFKNQTGQIVGRLNFNGNGSKYNVGLGQNALKIDSSGYDNTAIGANTLGYNSTGQDNTAIGRSALSQNTSGSNNTAMGYLALDKNTTGSFNTAVGDHALGNANSITGSNNTALGYNACNNVTTGSYKTCIGTGSQPTTPNTTSNEVWIGTGASAVYIPGSLTVTGLVSSAGATLTSDKRLKNIAGANTDGLNKIRQLKIFNYTFKDDKSKTPRVGIMAQDLQKIFPNAVIKGPDGYLSVRQEDMFYALVNAVKELDEQNKQLKSQNAALEARLLKLEAKLK